MHIDFSFWREKKIQKCVPLDKFVSAVAERYRIDCRRERERQMLDAKQLLFDTQYYGD